MTHYFYSKMTLILFDNRYYCDFKILLNLLIPLITRVSVFGTHVRMRTPCIPLDKLYIMNQSDKLQLHYLLLML